MFSFMNLCLSTKDEETTIDLLKRKGNLRNNADCSQCGLSCIRKTHFVGDVQNVDKESSSLRTLFNNYKNISRNNVHASHLMFLSLYV